MTENSNQTLIDELLELIKFLETNSDFPRVNFSVSQASARSADALKSAAQMLGTFRKSRDDYNMTLRRAFGERVSLSVRICNENLGCKKVITWDCPEGLESLLRPDDEEAEVEA